MRYRRIALLVLLLVPLPTASAQSLLPRDWSPKQAADRVLAGLIMVTAPHVKGAHDAAMVIVNDRAFIVAEVNDEQPGESASWPCVYVAMSVVSLKTMAVERIIPFARSEQAFANETLPVGIASLVLMCDIPAEQKERLLMNFVQYGIDLWGIVRAGHPGWPAHGGHGSGRKWPIVFASIMLGDPFVKAMWKKYRHNLPPAVTPTAPPGRNTER